jgi:hypothetical protein
MSSFGHAKEAMSNDTLWGISRRKPCAEIFSWENETKDRRNRSLCSDCFEVAIASEAVRCRSPIISHKQIIPTRVKFSSVVWYLAVLPAASAGAAWGAWEHPTLLCPANHVPTISCSISQGTLRTNTAGLHQGTASR